MDKGLDPEDKSEMLDTISEGPEHDGDAKEKPSVTASSAAEPDSSAPEHDAPAEEVKQKSIDVRWLPLPPHRKPALLIGDSQASVVAWPYGRDAEPLADITEVSEEESPRTEAGIDVTEDSLYDILSGRKSAREPMNESEGYEEHLDDEMDTSRLEDTFRGKCTPANFEDSTDCFF